ncbi:MAG: YybH family protein [Actinomycetota bacterium]
MGRNGVRGWVERYVRAWETNDPQDIGSLFTDDATYYTAPFREPWTGRQAIVDGWLDRKDESGDWTFRFEVQGIDGDLAFVRGWTTYRTDSDYSNLWVIRLDPDGRASEFIEWWMAEEGS